MSTMVLPVAGVGPVLGTGFVSGVWGAVAFATSAVTLAMKSELPPPEAELEAAVLAPPLEDVELELELHPASSRPAVAMAAPAAIRRLADALLTKTVMSRTSLGRKVSGPQWTTRQALGGKVAEISHHRQVFRRDFLPWICGCWQAEPRSRGQHDERIGRVLEILARAGRADQLVRVSLIPDR
jgi:hypothetical protein